MNTIVKKNSTLLMFLPWFICILGAAFYAYEYFLRITPSVMTSQLMRYYHIDDESLGNLSAFYYYVYTPMQVVVGVLMDRYGPRRLLSLAMTSCVLGTILFAVSRDLYVAEMGRFLIGLGSAFALVGVLKLATIWLPERYFATFSGMAIGLGMLGAISGDVLLTHLVDIIGWQQTVYLSAILGVILAIFMFSFIRDKRPNEEKTLNQVLDLKEAIKGLFKIAQIPQIWMIGIIGALLYLPISAFAELWGIPYLQEIHHFTHEESAIANSLVFWGWIIGGIVAGWVSDKLRRRDIPMFLWSLIAAVIAIVFLYVPGLSHNAVRLLMFAFGFFCSVQVIVFAAGKDLCPQEFSATAISFVNMVVMLGGVIFQPLIGWALDALWDGKMQNGVQVFTPHAYQIALIILPIGIIVASLMSIFFLRPQSSTEELEKKFEKMSNQRGMNRMQGDLS